MDISIYLLIGAVVLFAICLTIANTATSSFMRKYQKYSQTMLNTPFTAGDFVIRLIADSGYSGLKVAYTEKELEDAYSSRDNLIILSTQTINSYSIAGYATAAHEFGHAVQHNSGKLSYRFLKVLKIISGLFGRFSFPLIIVGLALMLLGVDRDLGQLLAIVGGAIFVISLLAQLLTIPIEFDASNIGLKKIREYNLLEGKEYRMAKRFLKSAGLTYVASFLCTILAWTFLVPRNVKNI